MDLAIVRAISTSLSTHWHSITMLEIVTREAALLKKNLPAVPRTKDRSLICIGDLPDCFIGTRR